MFIRSLDEKELETEEFENMTGEKMEKIFPASAVGQSMRWSKFKNNDPRDIYDVISQRVFPAIKNMKHGRLPDFTAQGELVKISDDSGDDVQNETAFARYMSDAMFLIPTPQVLQRSSPGWMTGMSMTFPIGICKAICMSICWASWLLPGRMGNSVHPKTSREMLVELLQPTPDDTICDPASCGTAGFLVSAAEYIRGHYEDVMTREQWEHFAGDAFIGFETPPHHAAYFRYELNASLHQPSRGGL